MLNDLLAVADALQAHGMAFAPRHPGVKDMRKGGALGLMLSPDGAIAGLLPLGGGRGELWTLRDGQQNGFPGLPTDAPLLAISAEETAAHKANWKAAKADVARRRVELDRLIATYPFAPAPDWPRAGHRARIAERLTLLRGLEADTDTAALPAVHARFLRALEREPGLLAELYAHLVAPDLPEALYDWAAVVLTDRAPILIDVDPTEGLRSVRHAGQIEALTLALASSETANTAAPDGICALTGATSPLHRGNFPQPNLPGLGQTYLFARNSDIPAMARYGRSASASFPLAAGEPERLAGALDRLTAPEYEGKTWRLIPGETGKTPDLLLAILPGDPDAPLAGALGGEEAAEAEATFTRMTALVLKHATGETKEEFPEAQVMLLALRQLDPANRKTIYHRQLSATEFHAAATRWQSAMDNLPDAITLPVPDGKRLKSAEPPFLPPLSLPGVSRRSYTRGKPSGVDVAGIPLTTAYQIFLQEGDARTATQHALRLLLARNTPLLVGLADARARGLLRELDRTGTLRADALRAMRWFGALLFLLHDERTNYMNDAAFRLGQLLAAADNVHLGYCIDVRSGAIPPTLLGNALLTTAATDPNKALALLCRRWPPYASWAKHNGRIFEKAGSVGPNDAFALRRAAYQARDVSEIAAQLHGHIPKKPDDAEAFQAELLLGYMAGLPRSQNSGSDAANSVEEDEEA